MKHVWHMCIYISVCMYTRTHTYIYIYRYMHLYTHARTCISHIGRELEGGRDEGGGGVEVRVGSKGERRVGPRGAGERRSAPNTSFLRRRQQGHSRQAGVPTCKTATPPGLTGQLLYRYYYYFYFYQIIINIINILC